MGMDDSYTTASLCNHCFNYTYHTVSKTTSTSSHYVPGSNKTVYVTTTIIEDRCLDCGGITKKKYGDREGDYGSNSDCSNSIL